MTEDINYRPRMFSCRFGLDSDVTVRGLRAKIVAVKFAMRPPHPMLTESAREIYQAQHLGLQTQYLVRFYTGESDAWVDEADVRYPGNIEPAA